MRKIQNANITFRVTNDLKERLTEYCLENDCHNSVVIRHALASYLKAQREAELPPLMGSSLSQLR
jgi:predicted transcriptional regulator